MKNVRNVNGTLLVVAGEPSPIVDDVGPWEKTPEFCQYQVESLGKAKWPGIALYAALLIVVAVFFTAVLTFNAHQVEKSGDQLYLPAATANR